MSHHSAIQEFATLRRCAIYTRKSNEHSVEQDFNSLEAQAELCSAYITSQQHRGWKQIDKVYSDDAQSGGTIDRPALQELLADVEANRLDIVIIYKLDRLSRSLLDFVRLMAIFERNAVSFVCITQNFDTGDSLGRLIMNVLLTFAQFEREITGDRIRDKRRAMASKGIWVGSHAPYGYDYVDKRLVPNEAEAANVRFMYDRYLASGSILAVWREATSKGIPSKIRTSRDGEIIGGLPIHRASVRSILCNPVYMGDVTHRGTRHRGSHPAIISKRLWNAVEKQRLATVSERRSDAPADLLPSDVFDSFGRRMAMSRKYRSGECERLYYSYPTVWGQTHRVPRMRSKASELEGLVLAAVEALLADRERIRAALLETGRRGANLDRCSAGCEAASRRLETALIDQKIAILAALIVRIEIARDNVKVILRIAEMERFLRWDGLDFFAAGRHPKRSRQPTYLLHVAASGVRLSRRLQLPVEPRDPASNARPDRKLLLLLQQVRRAQQLIDTEREAPVAALARRMKRNTGHFMKLLRLNYLAPDIITAILDGTQPANLTRRQLLDADFPTDWPTQRKLFGFPEQPPLKTCERF